MKILMTKKGWLLIKVIRIGLMSRKTFINFCIYEKRNTSSTNILYEQITVVFLLQPWDVTTFENTNERMQQALRQPFEVKALKQRVTVSDCHPCSVHSLPCRQRDFTCVQPRNCAGTASVTSRLQATASNCRRCVYVCVFLTSRSHKLKKRKPSLLQAPSLAKWVVWLVTW